MTESINRYSMRSLHQQTTVVESRVCYKNENSKPLPRKAYPFWLLPECDVDVTGLLQHRVRTRAKLVVRKLWSTADCSSGVVRCSKPKYLRFGGVVGRCDCSGNVLSSILTVQEIYEQNEHISSFCAMLAPVGERYWCEELWTMLLVRHGETIGTRVLRSILRWIGQTFFGLVPLQPLPLQPAGRP